MKRLLLLLFIALAGCSSAPEEVPLPQVKGNAESFAAPGIPAAPVGDMFKSENLAGLTNKTTARSNLDLVIGTHVQAFDADLSTWAGITPGTGVSTALQTNINSGSSGLLTVAGAATITNKTIAGDANTLTNIGNSSLTNSSLTVNGQSISLGGSGTVTANWPTARTIGGASIDGSGNISYNSLLGVTTAADKVYGFSGAGTPVVFDASSFGRSLWDDANAAAVRSTLELGTMATQAASGVSITGGSITGITDLTVPDGGTGASTFTSGALLKGAGTSPITVATAGVDYLKTNIALRWLTDGTTLDYPTLTAARTAASNGQIDGAPGNFALTTSLAKNAVNFGFPFGGTTLTYSGTTVSGHFDDGPNGFNGAASYTIGGYVDLVWNGTVPSNAETGAISVNNASSLVTADLNSISQITADSKAAGIFHSAGYLNVNVRNKVTSNGAYSVWWKDGESHLNIPFLENTGTGICFYASSTPEVPTGSFWLTSDLVQSNGATFVIEPGVNNESRIWVDSKEIRGGGQAIRIAGCTNYFRAMKIVARQSIA